MFLLNSGSRTHIVRWRWWSWWCSARSVPSSPARSSPPPPQACQGPAWGWAAEARRSAGLNAGCWNGVSHGSLAQRNAEYLQSSAPPKPGIWPAEPGDLTPLTCGGRRWSWEPANTLYCLQDRGSFHSAWFSENKQNRKISCSVASTYIKTQT